MKNKNAQFIRMGFAFGLSMFAFFVLSDYQMMTPKLLLYSAVLFSIGGFLFGFFMKYMIERRR